MRRSIGPAALAVALLIAGCSSPSTPEASSDPASGGLGLAVGAPAPDFTLKTLDGSEVTLADYKGRPVFINFWASWCGPCRTEMPEIVAAYQKHKEAGLEVLAIDNTRLDIIDDVRDFVTRFEMPFPILLDESGDVIAVYRVFGLPTSVFIDAAGIVRAVNAGPMDGATIAEYLKEILPN